MYHYTDGGLRNVWLTNGYVERNTPYGKGVSFHDVEGLTKTICEALVKKPSKLTGVEFRYLRTSMLMSQKSLGKVMGFSEQAVAKWEKTGKVPKAADALIRFMYAGKTDGNQKISTMIDALNFIDHIANTKIIISESRSKKWKSQYKTDDNDESYALAA